MSENDKTLEELKRLFALFSALQLSSQKDEKTPEEIHLAEIEYINPYFSRYEYSKVESVDYGG